jgi:hypothetical protein
MSNLALNLNPFGLSVNPRLAVENAFLGKLSTGLRRQSLNTCSKWAVEYRVMGKPYPGKWSFDHHPWLKDMHDSTAELNIGQKGAQVGYTELLMNWAFFNIDRDGESVLYILPTDDNASDFSSSRFDQALDLSDYLSNLFSDVKNTKHKRAGSANLFVRGSRSKNKLISVPVSRLAVDELDKMVIEHIPLAWERMSGQLTKQAWFVSTPTAPNVGINKYFQESNQQRVFFKCPHCSKLIEMKFPESFVMTAKSINDAEIKKSHYICYECKNVLDHTSKDLWMKDVIWVPAFTDRDVLGWHVNQMYSRTVSPEEFAKQYLKSQIDPVEEQEFYNSKLGLPHLVKGARVDDGEITACLASHTNAEKPALNTIVTMGVDVGKWLHFEIDEWSLALNANSADLHVLATPTVKYIGRVAEFEELDDIMLRYMIMHCVIDANPERRKALEFCNRFPGLATMCFYGNESKGKEISLGKELPSCTVDRTSWLDVSIGRFAKGKKCIRLPYDCPHEYKEHVKSLMKIYAKDANGNPTAEYINGGGDDHFGHARNYAEIALSLCAANLKSQNISKVM